LERPARVRPTTLTGARSWIAGAVLGVLCLAAGLWGYYAEDPTKQTLSEVVTYFWLPLVILVFALASLSRRPMAALVAVGLLDIEAALLGSGELISLPFIVAVPLVGVAVAARLVPVSRLRIPYLAAWAGSSLGVAMAVLRTLDLASPSAIVVIPAFMAVDALALAMFWTLDSGRLRGLNAAAEAEARVRDLLNGVDLVALGMGNDSRIELINDFTLKLTGWTREEVIGADWWDTFATPERREAARGNYSRIIAERSSMDHQRESVIMTKEGGRRLIRWSHVTRHDAHGSVAGVVSLGEDITAIRAAETAARRGSEMLSTLVVSSPLPTVVVGLDLVVQLWNPAVAELLGWTEADAVGLRVPAAVYGHDRWVIGRRFMQAIKGRPFDGEVVELSRRDGEAVRVRLYGGALNDQDGRPMAIAMQAVDVTAALTMEDQLREAQKMEAVGRLAGGVAHDFNNSLTAIGGFAALIASGTKEPETKEAADTILGAAKRAADLTRELLAYSRRSILQPQTIDVNELIGEVRPVLMRLLGKDVSVVVESHVSKALVSVDPTGLERVILNLAVNARDAMPDGGRITISTERRSADAAVDGEIDWVVLTVADTGDGIPTELHSRVFDPFFTTKPVGSGTGLGLAVVMGFVVQSGGKVGLKSEPGRGTVIEIFLPEVADTRKPPAALPAGSIWEGGGETILLVEDEPAVAALSFQILSQNGYKVLLADSGQSAITLLKGHSGPIALLLVDVILPDMRGPQLVEEACALHQESAVLYVSGYTKEAIWRHGDLPDGTDLIEKPFALDHLLAGVRTAINARSEVSVQ
jgi:two-component system cell cycle sensor histidine kinase/response regulator CckA